MLSHLKSASLNFGMTDRADPIFFLTSACKKTLAALQLAASSVSMLRSFDMNTPENARVNEEFSAARAKIQDCCSHFGVRIPLYPCSPYSGEINWILAYSWRHTGIDLRELSSKPWRRIDLARPSSPRSLQPSVITFLSFSARWTESGHSATHSARSAHPMTLLISCG
jgi:hypothetical protein